MVGQIVNTVLAYTIIKQNGVGPCQAPWSETKCLPLCTYRYVLMTHNFSCA